MKLLWQIESVEPDAKRYKPFRPILRPQQTYVEIEIPDHLIREEGGMVVLQPGALVEVYNQVVGPFVHQGGRANVKPPYAPSLSEVETPPIVTATPVVEKDVHTAKQELLDLPTPEAIEAERERVSNIAADLFAKQKALLKQKQEEGNG